MLGLTWSHILHQTSSGSKAQKPKLITDISAFLELNVPNGPMSKRQTVTVTLGSSRAQCLNIKKGTDIGLILAQR